MGEKARAGDGVVGGAGLIDGRPVFCYAQDATLRRRLARRGPRRHDRARAGARRSRPGAGRRVRRPPAARGCRRASPRSAATAGSSAGSSRCPGRVPQISIITGLSAGGGAYSPALTDWVVMTEDVEHVPDRPRRRPRGARRGRDRRGARRPPRPRAQRRLPLRRADRRRRGHLRASCSATCRAIATCRRRSCRAAAATARPTRTIVPAEPRRVYDVREVIRGLVDGGELLEVSAGWARNLVTGFARIDGRTGRRDRQPAALPRRRARRRQLARRAPASSRSATRSGSRCWCSSTRPGSCPGPAGERRA